MRTHDNLYRAETPMRPVTYDGAFLVSRLEPIKDRCVFGSLVYPSRYHRQNLRRDLHHFLRQVFQQCRRLERREAQLKRVFFEEVHDGEGVHAHFVMEVPADRTPEAFARLCEQIWTRIALRERRAHTEARQWRRSMVRYHPLEPRTRLIKHGDRFTQQYRHLVVSESQTSRSSRALAQVVAVDDVTGVISYCLKWDGSQDSRFASAVICEASTWTVRGHSTATLLV